MNIDLPQFRVSAATMARFERDMAALKVAQQNVFESWQAVLREEYSRSETEEGRAELHVGGR